MTSENINNNLDKKIAQIINKYNKTDIAPKIKNLVLSGGGVKGIALVGAMKCLEDNNILQHIKTFVGTSVGGIISCLYCIGYKPDELIKFINLFDLSNLKSLNPSDFIKKFGLDDGTRLMFVLEKMIISKKLSKDITFGELYKITGLKLILATVCLNDKQVHYLSHITHPKLSILLGMRMTSSLPLWFTPVSYHKKLYIDGGCIDNYPIQLFEKELDSTLGVYLADTREYIKDISNTEDFLINLVQCLFEGVTCNSIKGYEKYTVKLQVPKITMMDLTINLSLKKELYDSGYSSVMKYIKTQLHK